MPQSSPKVEPQHDEQQHHHGSDLFHRPRPREFHPSYHHPIIHFAQHIISPLSAALFIFTVHKTWQRKAMGGWLRSVTTLLRAKELSLSEVVRPRRVAGTALLCGVAAYAAATAPPVPETVPEHVASVRKLYQMDELSLVEHSLTKWWTTAYVSSVFRTVHDRYGLPWWATIALVTVGLRVCLIPVNLLLLRNSLRMKMNLLEINRLSDLLKDHTLSHQARLEASRALWNTFKQGGCSPFGQIISFPILLPVTILSVFGAVDNLCLAEPSMATEGALWFPDLIARDDTKLLPILSALTWLWQVEMGCGVHYASMPNARLAARLSSIAFIPLGATLPNGVFVFWITTNLFAIARALAARSDVVRKALKIPLRKELDAITHHFPPARGT